MKKSILFLLTICFCNAAKAQISQGTVSAGGTINYYSNSSKSYDNSTSRITNKSNNLNLSPRVGYFISDDLSIGASLSIYSNSQTSYIGNNNNEVVQNSSGFGIGPFVRYYKSIGENFYIFGEGSVGIGTGRSKTISGNTTTKSPNSGVFGVSVSPGIAFFPAKKFGIELSFTGISFRRTASKNSDSTTRNSTSNFNFGPDTFAPNIGLQYYF